MERILCPLQILRGVVHSHLPAEAATMSATPRPSPLNALKQSPFEPPETHGGVPDSWEGVCDWVLGRRLDLWQEIFEQPFLKVAFCNCPKQAGFLCS